MVAAAAQTRPAPDPTAETVRVDQPRLRTRPLPRPSRSPGAPSAPDRPNGCPLRPRGPAEDDARAIALGILSLVGVLVVGALLLWNPWRSDLDGAAQPEQQRRRGIPSPADKSPAATPAPSEPAATRSACRGAGARAARRPSKAPAATVSDYYAMLPGDLDAAWPLMTADYQENHAGGRDAYEAFWAAIAGVEIADVSAPAPDQAQATLTYHYRDGSVVQEVTAYRLVDEGGVLKIAATEVLSSS